MKRLAALLLLLSSPAYAKTMAVVGVALDQSSASPGPLPQKLSTPAGETGSIGISVTHPGGAAYDLTGAQLLLTVNGKISRQATIMSPASLGIATFPLVIADTQSMLGTYTYDVWLTASDGSRYQVVPASSFVVTAGIGQPGQAVTVPATQQPLAQGPAGATGPAGNPQSIQVAGVTQASEPALNFSSGVTCSDNPGSSRLDCSAAGGGGGGTLQSDYTAGGAGGGAIALTSSGGGIVIADNATPIGGALFKVTDHAGTTTFFEVDASTAGSAVATFGDGASAPVSSAGTGTIIYNGTSKTFQSSTNAGAYTDFVSLTPSAKGDLAVFDGTAWQRLAAGTDTFVLTADSVQATGVKWAAASGGGGGGTQGGATTTNHVPYASANNTLGDSEMSFNSATHTFSVASTAVIDFSASLSPVKIVSPISGVTGDVSFSANNSGVANFVMSNVGGTSAFYLGPKTDGNYLIGTASQIIIRTNGGNDTVTMSNSFFNPTNDNAMYLGTGTRWKAISSYWRDTKIGAQLTAATTITPTAGMHHVTGATSITTIDTTNVPTFAPNVSLKIIADGGTITYGTGGNIAASGTITQNHFEEFVYDSSTTTWYPH